MSDTGNGILVNAGGMNEIIDRLKTAVGQIDKRMNNLEDDLKPLKSEWSGQAKDTYEVSKAKWDQAIYDMKVLLNDTATQVETSHAEYNAADKRGADAFQI